MRKLLINSTALATVAGLTASVALADVSITATTEYAVTTVDSTVAATNGNFHTQASEIGFTFATKTDSGMSLSYNSQLTSGGTVGLDESKLTIGGDFGTVVLGEHDGVGGKYGMGANDLIAEESAYGTTLSATISTTSDINIGTGDTNKVAYHIPTDMIAGFSAGMSLEDSGAKATANAATDTVSYGARYVTSAGGLDITFAAAYAKTETAVTLQDTNATNTAVKLVKGNLSAIFANTNYKGDDEDRSSTGYSLSYNMGDGLILGAYKDKSVDDLDAGEKYSISGIEAQYAITNGLMAVLTMDSFDYDSGTADAANAGQISDDGSLTKLTIKAAF